MKIGIGVYLSGHGGVSCDGCGGDACRACRAYNLGVCVHGRAYDDVYVCGDGDGHGDDRLVGPCA